MSDRVDKLGCSRLHEGDWLRRVDPTQPIETWRRGAQIAVLAAASAAGVAIALLALEAVLALALRADARDLGIDLWTKARREYYMRFERHILQYLPECAEFDPTLAYRLKPGRCRFHNREYDVEIVVNSAGLRDREEALDRPRIVVTGDSFAVGWGVAQEETLSAVLAGLTGEKTLNAAQPSYGTAREMLLLRKLDLSAAHTLVIQYCENDFIENARFLKRNGQLSTMAPDEYQATVEQHLGDTRYYPGKHLRHLLPLFWWAARGGDPTDYVRDCTIEAPTFVRVLDRAGLRAGPLRVIAFEAMYAAGQTSCFSRELAKLAGPGARLPRWIAELRVIEPALDASDYYPLDEHLKASGYRKIARAIAGAMAD
ncbi:MAG TPA: hypothetical protein VKH41_00500 [Myxococcota bacterium]|nr:hypothetical protein [Myxococcota bacterium]